MYARNIVFQIMDLIADDIYSVLQAQKLLVTPAISETNKSGSLCTEEAHVHQNRTHNAA